MRLDRQNPYLRLQSVTVFVRDLDRSLNFFVNQLGFQLMFDGRVQAGRPFVAVHPPDGTANLTLMMPEPNTEQYKLIGRPTQIAFITEDVLAKFRDWSAKGVVFQNTPRLRRMKHGTVAAAQAPETRTTAPAEPAPIWGGVFARFKDPDGNIFSLVSFDEVTQYIESQRRAITEKREEWNGAWRKNWKSPSRCRRGCSRRRAGAETLEFAGVCLPARHVGGDYYDFLQLGQDRVGADRGISPGKALRPRC